jgi:hypothetical protein
MDAVQADPGHHCVPNSLLDNVGSAQRCCALGGARQADRQLVQDLHPTQPAGNSNVHGAKELPRCLVIGGVFM